MSLTASGIAQIGWTYTKTNSGFTDSQQGPDSLSGIFGFADSDAIYVANTTLSASGTTTLDLQALTDFFGDAINFATIQGIIIQCSSGTVRVFGAGSNAFQFFLADPSDKVVLKSGATIMFSNDTLANGGTVDGTHKNLKFEETSTTNPCTFKVVLVGKKV